VDRAARNLRASIVKALQATQVAGTGFCVDALSASLTACRRNDFEASWSFLNEYLNVLRRDFVVFHFEVEKPQPEAFRSNHSAE